MRYHLLKKPHVGGTPIKAAIVTTNAAIVTGILKNTPLRSSSCAWPSRYTMQPIAMNSAEVIAASATT